MKNHSKLFSHFRVFYAKIHTRFHVSIMLRIIGYSLVYLFLSYTLFSFLFVFYFVSFLFHSFVYILVSLYYVILTHSFNKEKYSFLLSFHIVSEPWLVLE